MATADDPHPRRRVAVLDGEMAHVDTGGGIRRPAVVFLQPWYFRAEARKAPSALVAANLVPFQLSRPE